MNSVVEPESKKIKKKAKLENKARMVEKFIKVFAADLIAASDQIMELLQQFIAFGKADNDIIYRFLYSDFLKKLAKLNKNFIVS